MSAPARTTAEVRAATSRILRLRGGVIGCPQVSQRPSGTPPVPGGAAPRSGESGAGRRTPAVRGGADPRPQARASAGRLLRSRVRRGLDEVLRLGVRVDEVLRL